MNIVVSDLGNVEYADLDLTKRLTVFCGPNNTGKTYVSYIIYALLKSPYYMSEINVNDISAVFSKNELTFDLNIEELNKYRYGKLNVIKTALESIFGLSDSDKLSLFKKFNVQYGQTDKEFEDSVIRQSIDLNFLWNGVNISVKKNNGSKTIRLIKDMERSTVAEDTYLFSYQLTMAIFEILVNSPYVRSCIFPVERNSIYTFNKELSIQRNELIEQMQALKDNRKIGFDSIDKLLGRSTRYPLAIRDCLSVANDLSNLQKQRSKYATFAELIEKKLLEGKISVTKEGDVEFVARRGQRLPIHLSSSIVKTLSSLTFYLKHLAHSGDMIIIDEPEMNLHPDAQVVLARIFGQLTNHGLNLLISTHSDYIIREFNNMITLGSIKDRASIMKELNYEEDDVISSNDVAVFLFKPKRRDSKKVRVEKVEVKDDGFSMKTIDDVISQMNEYSDRLNYKLRYDE